MSTKPRTESEKYQDKKTIFASLNKEAKALGLKDMYEHHSESGEEEVVGILPKDYKTDRVIEISLREVGLDEAIEKVEASE